MVSTVRTDSPARWAKAAERAAAEGIRVMQLPTTGVWVATSGTDATTAYVVTLSGCECYAGANGDPVCKHRSALRSRVAAQAAPIATVITEARMCSDCLGTGMTRISTGWRLSDWIAIPCSCGAEVA